MRHEGLIATFLTEQGIWIVRSRRLFISEMSDFKKSNFLKTSCHTILLMRILQDTMFITIAVSILLGIPASVQL